MNSISSSAYYPWCKDVVHCSVAHVEWNEALPFEREECRRCFIKHAVKYLVLRATLSFHPFMSWYKGVVNK